VDWYPAKVDSARCSISTLKYFSKPSGDTFSSGVVLPKRSAKRSRTPLYSDEENRLCFLLFATMYSFTSDSIELGRKIGIWSLILTALVNASM
jgi:hypothetical protein